MKIRLVLSGRSYPTTGSAPDELIVPDGASVDDALELLRAQVPDATKLPASCLIAVSGRHLGTFASHQAQTLTDGDELVIIAPVAGG